MTLSHERVFKLSPSAWLLVHVLGRIMALGPKCVTARILRACVGILGGFPLLAIRRVDEQIWAAEVPSKQKVICLRPRSKWDVLLLARRGSVRGR